MIITDEMVEAGCRGEWRHLVPDDDLSWDLVDEDTKTEWRESVRAGLEAALGEVER